MGRGSNGLVLGGCDGSNLMMGCSLVERFWVASFVSVIEGGFVWFHSSLIATSFVGDSGADAAIIFGTTFFQLMAPTLES